MKSKISIISMLLWMVSVSSFAVIQLPQVFTDNMVLQQQTDAPVWGKAFPNAEVKIITSWNNQTYKTKAGADGAWKVKIKTPKAGGPYEISISDEKTITLHNVLIGEVWICSGQSNMEMPLAGWGKVDNYEQEIAAANFPQIRLFHVEKATANQPLNDLKKTRGGWQTCSPATIAEFSSVAYFFGRNLNQHLHIPIGLINTSWGGTVAEAWTSMESLEYMPDFKEAATAIQRVPEADAQQAYEKAIKEWNDGILALDAGFKQNTPVWAATGLEVQDWKEMTLPGVWEEQGLNNFDGIVWYRKTITIPQDWAGKECVLNLGEIDDNEITYLNGTKIGETTGYNLNRNYTIPGSLVKAGNAVITVRVTDTGGEGGFYGKSNDLYIKLVSGTTNVPLSGAWRYKVAVDMGKYKSAPVSPNDPNRCTVLYNAMIHPIFPYAIQGAIWYQGEANAYRPYQYRELLPLMICDWRKQWQRDFPFYFVQLANYMKKSAEPQDTFWPKLREAQLQTLHLENTGMAVTIDIGDEKDIHPKNKQDVGIRLALAARANTYSENIAYSGPVYESYKIEEDKISISFKHTNNGLKAKGNTKLIGFAIAGSDHKFYWADAVIRGNEVVVSSSNVKYPVSVRYAWADNPDCNLYNGANLPASPFRTDDWR